MNETRYTLEPYNHLFYGLIKNFNLKIDSFCRINGNILNVVCKDVL